MKLRLLTTGESHGPAIIATLDGMVAGLPVTQAALSRMLLKRKRGFGRSARHKIEPDEVEFLGGVRFGKTTGASIGLIIRNQDFANWAAVMDAVSAPPSYEPVTKPRPGHADLAGAIKFGHRDIRDVLERASSRETASRVAAGAVCAEFLARLNVSIHSAVLSIGKASVPPRVTRRFLTTLAPNDVKWDEADASDLGCPHPGAEEKMRETIKAASSTGDSLGGTFVVAAYGVPVGLGSYSEWDLRLTSRLAQAVMSVPAVKAMEFGAGFDIARTHGSKAHDEILYKNGRGLYRRTNRSGGVEGGISNGQPIVIHAAMKPIPTLTMPLRTVDIATHAEAPALRERADVCAVPAAAVVAEAMVAFVLADAFLAKFGGDSLREVSERVDSWRRYVATF
jgi:chorismate synthase